MKLREFLIPFFSPDDSAEKKFLPAKIYLLIALAAGACIVPAGLLLAFLPFPLSLILSFAALAVAAVLWVTVLILVRQTLDTRILLQKKLEAHMTLLRSREAEREQVLLTKQTDDQEYVSKWAFTAAQDLIALRSYRFSTGDSDLSLSIDRQTTKLAKALERLNSHFDENRSRERLAFNIMTIELYQFISETVVHNSGLLRGKHIGLRRSVSKLRTKSDPDQLHFIVDSLLHFAAQNTSEGGTIGLSCKENSGQVLLSVEDAGNGFTQPELSALFMKNPDGETSRLYYAREYARLLDHDITAESQPGKGTKVTLILECA